MDFSIIIPIYNTRKKYIETCLEKIADNSECTVEVLLIDDGSTEETRTFLQCMKTKYPFIKLFLKENGGAAEARNYGTKRALGKYLTYVDSDDYLFEGILDSIKKILDREKPDLFIARITRKEEEGEKACSCEKGSASLKNELRKYYTTLSDKKFRGNTSWINRAPHAKFVKRSIAQNCLFRSELLIGEDAIWNFDILNASDKVLICEQPVYYYRFVRGSLTQSFHADLPEKMELLLKAYKDEINTWDEGLRGYYEVIALEHFSGMMRMYVFAEDDKDVLDRYREIVDTDLWKDVFKNLNMLLVRRQYRLTGLLGKLHWYKAMFAVFFLHYRVFHR